MVESFTDTSGRRMRKAPAPACEQEIRRVTSRRGTVAPVFAASNRSQASLASSHAEVLMTAESLRCVKRGIVLLVASSYKTARSGSRKSLEMVGRQSRIVAKASWIVASE